MKKLTLTVLLANLLFIIPSFADNSVSISMTEADGLKFIREEEKLARDVYLKFFRDYGVRVFKKLASSEQSHMDAILKMMNSYNIPDSSTGEEGTFNNPDLQEFYDMLIDTGSTSLVNAYLVGALIEETDIKDIEEIKDTAASPNIHKVYDNLLCRSRNHIRTFVAKYERATSRKYQVQIPEMAETVAEILSSSHERCCRK